MMCFCVGFFFFVKQKTAYEMRISDWSSDVCSSGLLMVLEALWLKTGKGVYANLYRYWLKIFAVVFGMGVVSGIVMSYQFGTNWSVFSDKTGPVIGPLMAYEVLTAFFLEAGFLGVMLRSAEHTSELQSLMRKSYAFF